VRNLLSHQDLRRQEDDRDLARQGVAGGQEARARPQPAVEALDLTPLVSEELGGALPVFGRGGGGLDVNLANQQRLLHDYPARVERAFEQLLQKNVEAPYWKIPHTLDYGDEDSRIYLFAKYVTFLNPSSCFCCAVNVWVKLEA
jgi:hypothetical protein